MQACLKGWSWVAWLYVERKSSRCGLPSKAVAGTGKEGACLQVALRLHEAAHDTKGCIKLPIALSGGHAGDDGMVGALVGSQAVRVARINDEVVPAIVQREAAALRHDAWIPHRAGSGCVCSSRSHQG